METILAKLKSDNPEVVLFALMEAESLSYAEKELFLKEVGKDIEITRNFIAISKAVIMHYIIRNI